jgi:hypothetical protein
VGGSSSALPPAKKQKTSVVNDINLPCQPCSSPLTRDVHQGARSPQGSLRLSTAATDTFLCGAVSPSHLGTKLAGRGISTATALGPCSKGSFTPGDTRHKVLGPLHQNPTPADRKLGCPLEVNIAFPLLPAGTPPSGKNESVVEPLPSLIDLTSPNFREGTRCSAQTSPSQTAAICAPITSAQPNTPSLAPTQPDPGSTPSKVGEPAFSGIPLPPLPGAIDEILCNIGKPPNCPPPPVPFNSLMEPLRPENLDQEPYRFPPSPGARLHRDRLGKLVQLSLDSLSDESSFLSLCVRQRGKTCLSDPVQLDHPANLHLYRLREIGAPALLHPAAPSWTPEDLDAAVRRGPHRSTNEFRTFLRDEFADMIETGQWIALPYSIVRHLPNLRLSPTGVVPQRDRRPRIIVDYTFSGVNQTTHSVAPDSLQFGHAFLRLLQLLSRADTRQGPIYISKTDLADAFMRVWVWAPSIPVLGALLPQLPGEDPLIAFPMILPMGWVDSPQYLCAISETIADITNDRLSHGPLAAEPHRLDELADTPPKPVQRHPAKPPPSIRPPEIRSCGPFQLPLNYVDVFMDDFILVTQLQNPDRLSARRTLFNCIDQVLRPLHPSDNPFRKEPNSIKKLAQGDACWSTQKVVLGWLIDTTRRTIELPPHRVDRLDHILSSFTKTQRRTSRRKWQQLIGELRSMVLAIPGGRGLFSQLQSVLTYPGNAKPSDRLRLTRAVHDQLDDFRFLAQELSSRPTRWGELVDSDPVFIGAVDASGIGMGGVWFHYANHTAPLLWRSRFDPAITNNLVSATNKQGAITNSDLEQTGLVLQQDVLAQCYDIRECTVCALTDNTAALSRDQHGSTSTNAPSAYLCRLSALHQRAFRYRFQSSYIPGPLNVMADALSRRWDLDDSQLLAHFNSVFPQNQP